MMVADQKFENLNQLSQEQFYVSVKADGFRSYLLKSKSHFFLINYLEILVIGDNTTEINLEI